MAKETTSDDLFDFTIEEYPVVVGKKPNRKTFRSCRLFLSTYSDVFKAMFYGPLAEKQKEVALPEDDPRAFEIMIDFLSSGEIKANYVSDVLNVCILLDKYQVIHVRRKCVDYLLKNLSTEDVIEIYEMPTEFTHPLLRVASFHYICKNASVVLKTKSFVNSKFSTVHNIISTDNINVSSEIEIYNAVFSWLKEECRRKGETDELKAREIVEPLLKEIRLLTMTATEFCEGPGRNNLLTDHEKLSILANFKSPNEVQLPQVCNKIKTKRNSKCTIQSKLCSAWMGKPVKCFRNGIMKIEQKSKAFSCDACIYGVSFYTLPFDVNLIDFKLTIKNNTKNSEITEQVFPSLTFKGVVELFTDRSVFVAKDEQCEISLTADLSQSRDDNSWKGDCQLDEIYGTVEMEIYGMMHFHDIFIYRI